MSLKMVMMSGKLRVIVDIEVYRGYFVAVCLNTKTLQTRELYLHNIDRIKTMLTKNCIVGFNVINYDLPILRGIACGDLKTHDDIKDYSDKIIQGDMRHWEHKFGYENTEVIDLFEVAPGVRTSLKLYAGRMHVPKMQDLPIDPDATPTPDEQALLTRYCHNDVAVTLALYQSLLPQLELREKMGTGLMSKSDAQIAEAVLKEKLPSVSKPNIDLNMTWRYTVPSWLTFPELIDLTRGVDFSLSDKGAVVLPKELSGKQIKVGNTTYTLGIGGLHSTEECQAIRPDGVYKLVDFDVTSYYPSIILNQELYPEHLGREFLDVYREIVEQRVAAKHSGDKVTADSLKITINGSFGKFGSKYSFLFAPKLLTQTTITGQLALLELIMRLEREGIAVVSANTDGIVTHYHSWVENEVYAIIHQWEQDTGFAMEDSHYHELYSINVNNYLAVKSDGVKGKGVFTPAGLMKNPANEVVFDAIKANAMHHTSIKDYILNCTDLTKFITVRTVKGGAVKDGEYVGKVIRWYYSTETDTQVSYASNGNKVPRSEGARPVMDLPDELPTDLDYQWYIDEAYKVAESCGYEEYEW